MTSPADAEALLKSSLAPPPVWKTSVGLPPPHEARWKRQKKLALAASRRELMQWAAVSNRKSPFGLAISCPVQIAEPPPNSNSTLATASAATVHFLKHAMSLLHRPEEPRSLRSLSSSER